jgi:hypothetical protein
MNANAPFKSWRGQTPQGTRDDSNSKPGKELTMKAIRTNQSSNRSRNSRLRVNFSSLVKPVVALAAALLLSPPTSQAGGVVTNCTEVALRAAMVGGGLVTFACDGTITLTNTIGIATNTVLDGTGHQVAISGGSAVGVFLVYSNLAFSVLNLTIANGKAQNGGGIYNDSGLLTIQNVVFRSNHADPRSSIGRVPGQGGAIFNSSGGINATNCTFSDNQAFGDSGEVAVPNSGFPGLGGAIYTAGTFNASRCLFLRNSATGGTGAFGRDGSGASPSAGGDGGAGRGGAIYNAGSAVADSSLFATNSAMGGGGGMGGNGGLVIGFYYDLTGGKGGDGSNAEGGALFNAGTTKVVNCTFAGNITDGGSGGQGGQGGTFAWNPHGTAQGFPGGAGGKGGDASGAIYLSGGTLYLVNCTVAFNAVSPGYGGNGGVGSLGNPNGQPGTDGSVFAAGIVGAASLVNTLLATNSSAGNGGAGLIDLGHNLSSDGTCAFTNVGSMNNTDPKLGPLADNGGPTFTMALLPGSPAIDAGNTALAPATDQRGYPRPAGLAGDIGAHEYGSVMPTLAVSRSGATGLNILGSGNSNQPCRLLSSVDLLNWIPIATNQIGGDGTVLFHDDYASSGACRFYRLAMP